jgi:hypothetical protein
MMCLSFEMARTIVNATTWKTARHFYCLIHSLRNIVHNAIRVTMQDMGITRHDNKLRKWTGWSTTYHNKNKLTSYSCASK